jgi:catechol 2,3-dioxygenase-like lactoylglutathione lyase family enzyme
VSRPHDASGRRAPLGPLDFIYLPSRDVAGDVAFYTDVLGGEVGFAIEAFGTRVAEVRVSDESPRLLLAGHLKGEAPVLVHRVTGLRRRLAALEARGLDGGPVFAIPHGPCSSLVTPGGQHLALYEPTRPQADAHLASRRDF